MRVYKLVLKCHVAHDFYCLFCIALIALSKSLHCECSKIVSDKFKIIPEDRLP